MNESYLPEINGRVKTIIDKYSDGNIAEFARSLNGISQQRLDRLFKKDKRNNKYPSVHTEITQAILDKYPINPNWLMTGEGDMQTDDSTRSDNILDSSIKKNRFQIVYDFLRSQGLIHTQKDLAIKLEPSPPNISRAFNGDEDYLTDNLFIRLNETFNNIFNLNWLLTGEGNMMADNSNRLADNSESQDIHNVPLLPLSAIGGTLNDFTMSVRKFECEQLVSPIQGVDFGITVSGESMAPEYPSGSQVLIKKINEKAFIDWGRTYVLDTCNGVVIKKLFPSEDNDPSKVKCVSVNPSFPPFEVSLKDVYGIYRVLMSLALK